METYRLATDPRVLLLIDALDRNGIPVPKYGAVGIVVSLLKWTAQNAPNGNLSQFRPELLARMIEWEEDANILIASLKEAGFIRLQDQWIDLEVMLKAQMPALKWMDGESENDYRCWNPEDGLQT